MGDVSAAAVNESTSINQTNNLNQSIEKQTTVQTPSKINNSPKNIDNTASSNASQNSIDPSPKVYVNTNLVSDAANRVKIFVDTNHRLPNYVTISNYRVNMPQLLGLLTDGLIQINTGSKTSIALKSVNNPKSTSEDVKDGNLYKTEYLELAQKIKTTLDTTGTAPGYINSSLGKISYESLIYDYSKILSSYQSNKNLPSYISVKAGSTNQSTSEGTVTGNIPKNGYGPYNMVVTSQKVTGTAKCSCGKGTYTYKTNSFLNYCPQCHHYGTLGYTKPGAEGQWTCSYCDCDYCMQCGKEKISGTKLWLTPA